MTWITTEISPAQLKERFKTLLAVKPKELSRIVSETRDRLISLLGSSAFAEKIFSDPAFDKDLTDLAKWLCSSIWVSKRDRFKDSVKIDNILLGLGIGVIVLGIAAILVFIVCEFLQGYGIAFQ